jgi:hypothetical protein
MVVRVRSRRTGLIVVSADDAVADEATRALAARSLEVARVERTDRLRDLPPSIWPATLAVLVDLDLDGALATIELEQRYRGLLFDVTLLVVTSEPLGDEEELTPWAASFVKPLSGPALLRAVDREIAFDQYEPPVTRS